jgi:O-antigen/teichoic acid export membrane protein
VSLRSNIAAGYASQLWTALIGIVLMPLYLKYMGSEAYGLVGFFVMLQAFFNVLDLGLTPTIARESARYHGGALDALAFRQLFRSLTVLFVCVAFAGGGALFALAPYISEHWLKIRELPVAEVLGAVQIMAFSVALRWMGGLFRGVISGSERLVWLSGFNAVIAALRFGGAFASMWLWGYTPRVFFWHQFAVAALELGWLALMCHSLIPSQASFAEPIGWSFRPIRPLLRFSLTIAFTSSVWVLLTQSDKLVLSGILPLADYGYFTLAVLVAGGITLVTGPVSTALLPRLARLYAEGNHEEVLRLYNQSAQLVSVIGMSLMVTLAACSKSLLYAWTGSIETTEATAPILRLYAIGNGLLTMSAFPFYLQYARGNLRYHLLGNVFMVVILFPAIVMAAESGGGIGAGWVWLTMNMLYLFIWVAYVHFKLEPGLHMPWVTHNVLRILGPTLLVGLTLSMYRPALQNRLVELLHTGLFAFLCMVTAAFASPILRQRFLQVRPLRRVRSGRG